VSRRHRPQHQTVYQIHVQGELDSTWADWFNGLTITREGSNPPLTTLTGPVADQAALRGIVNKLWDLNLALLSLVAVGTNGTCNLEEGGR
jgi:hypothetical protein